MSAPDAAAEGFIDVEGGRVWYRSFGTGGATPLLMLHGGPGISHDYLDPLAVLADERRVVFYDQLGAGKSDRPQDPAPYTVERYVREIGAVRAALSLDEVYLYGQSWGTSLAVEYALTGNAGAPAQGVRGMALSSPCLSVKRWAEDAGKLIAAMPETERLALEHGRATNTIDTPEYRAASAAFDRKHLSRLDAPTEPMLRMFAGANMAVYKAVWGPTDFEATGAMRGFERAVDLHRLPMPVLYMCGRYDGATPETTAWYASLTPKSETVVFQDSSHVPHLEEPGEHERVLRDFLSRCDSDGSRQ
jgi:proline iminopeptidase